MSEETTIESTSGGSSGASRMPTRSKRTFSGPNGLKVDYKNIQLLQKFLSDSGKILPSRITAVSTKHQRHLSRAVKHARFLALIPYIAD